MDEWEGEVWLPEGEGDDGAGFFLTHGDGHALVLIHQIVLVRLADYNKERLMHSPC